MFWKLPWNSQSARRVPSTSENELGERLQEGEVVNSGDSNLSSVSLERTDCCEEPREQLIQTVFSEDSYELFEVFPPASGMILDPTYQFSMPYIPHHSAVQSEMYRPLYAIDQVQRSQSCGHYASRGTRRRPMRAMETSSSCVAKQKNCLKLLRAYAESREQIYNH